MTNALVSYDLFGAKITPSTIDDLLAHFDAAIGANRQCILGSQNMHGLHVRLENEAFRTLHDLPQTIVHIDGMPLVALCRLAGIAASPEQRVTLVDFVWPLLELAERRGWRVYYVGATPEAAARGAAAIRERLPALTLRVHHGYLGDPADAAEVRAEISAFAPHLVLPGMGMGVQERWTLDNLDVIGTASVLTMGACMEYVSGVVATPPRWMGRAGLEWLFRLAEQPGRFWRRYLVEPWKVLGYILRYAAAARRRA